MLSPRALALTAAVLFLVVLVVAGAEGLLLIGPDAAAGLEGGAALLGILAAVAAAMASPARSETGDERALLGGGLLETEALACYTVDPSGRVRSFSRGAQALFGWTSEELAAEGEPAAALRAHEAELLPEIERLFETGRAHAPRPRRVTHRSGRSVETVCALVPLARRGRVTRVAVLDADPRSPHLVEGRWSRLFHGAPAGLLSIDGEGRIDAVNHRLSDWVGRKADALQGIDVARAEVFPPELRERLRALAQKAGGGEATECDVVLVDAAGTRHPCLAVAIPSGGSGADVVFVDATSRQQLVAERDAARAAAEAARAAASETVTTQKGLTSSVAQLMTAREAARKDGGATRRPSAEEELERSGRILLANIERLGEAGRRRDAAAPEILLVDDNDENRELIAHMLRIRGAKVRDVASGREALDAVATKWFDIVLLDLQMPEMDGYEVVRRIRALPGGDGVSVVALTALGSDTVRERCLAEGMDDFVSKPVTLARVAELLDRWKAKGSRSL